MPEHVLADLARRARIPVAGGKLVEQRGLRRLEPINGGTVAVDAQMNPGSCL